MPASLLDPVSLERRRTLRRVASTALRDGWQWAGNHEGWWTPAGDMVALDALFRSTHPQDFLLETSYRVLPVAPEMTEVQP